MSGIIPGIHTAKPIDRGSKMGFERLTPPEAVRCMELGRRAAKLVHEYKRMHKREDLLDPDALLIAMDFALAHLHRTLMLNALMTCSNADFMVDFVNITIGARTRLDDTFPRGIHLRYALIHD